MLKKLIELLYVWSHSPESPEKALINRVKGLKKDQKIKLMTILDHIEDLNWKTVIMGSDDFKEFIKNAQNGIPIQNVGNISIPDTPALSPFGISSDMQNMTKVKDIPNPEIRQAMLDMGMDLEDEVVVQFLDYGDDDMFNDPALSLAGGLGPGMNMSMPNPGSGIGFGMESHGRAEDIDSVYNYAVFYLYGSKKNNIVTSLSVDVDKKLFVHEQMQFTIKTAADVIEVCEQLDKKFSLDAIYFIETDAAESVMPYVERGISNQTIKIEKLKELVSFEHNVENLPAIMGAGQVFMLSASWMVELQKEISEFFGSRSGFMPGRPTATYPRLKSITYAIDLWENKKDGKTFIRDYGINEETDRTTQD